MGEGSRVQLSVTTVVSVALDDSEIRSVVVRFIVSDEERDPL